MGVLSRWWAGRYVAVAAIVVLIGALLSGLGSHGASPSARETASLPDENAALKTQLVLHWLSGLPASRHVASGYFGGYSGGPWPGELAEITGSSSWCQTPVLSAPQVGHPCSLYQQTRRDPAVLACDYGADWAGVGIGNQPTAIDSNCNPDLVTWEEHGGLVSVSVHMPDPDPSGAVPMPASTFQELYSASSNPVQETFDGYLNQIAAGLAALQKAGVPVLFRPFLEGNGNWYWWGGQDPADFQALWRYTYSYLTAKGLHNLLWVYAPDCKGAGSRRNPGATINPAAEYPGNAYVDIVGLDCYLTAAQWQEPGSAAAPGNSTVLAEYREMTALGKPFAFSEVGFSSQTNSSGQLIAQDDASIIDAISHDFPAVTYFLAWNSQWGPAYNANASGLFSARSVLDRGFRLPSTHRPRRRSQSRPAIALLPSLLRRG